MSFQRVPLNEFADAFSALTELSSAALGARVLSVSDEFFAEAENLLKVEPAPSLKGQFGPNGALYSGWESRRHNPAYDWCIIKLGTTGTIIGFDVDTGHFNGNEAPEVSIDVLHGLSTEEPTVDDSRWTQLLPKVALGPNSRHLFKIPETTRVNFVKLNMYPDGGIARFRVYGKVAAVYPKDLTEAFDMAHVFAGGRVEFTSDQHFGIGSNLILPGRGKDMGDGWETKRSRRVAHKDWVVIRLGAPGVLEQIEIDTAHFKGNYPESCEVHALFSPDSLDWKEDTSEWTLILPRTKLGPHRQHYFQLVNVADRTYTHVKVTIHPDGGIKRVRVIGHRVAGDNVVAAQTVSLPKPVQLASNDAHDRGWRPNVVTVPVLPLTPEAFAPYGQVLQAYSDHAAVPKGVRITPANAGTASKFHKLSILTSKYIEGSGATTGISVYRCKPLEGVSEDRTSPLLVLERHPLTNQAFIPMGSGEGEEALANPADKYLVVVARSGEDDRPDMQTLRAFVATAAQGIVYDAGIWHQPMTVLGKPLDLACVETQIGDGSGMDCQVIQLDASFGEVKLRLPSF
ncbi:hypothetical protein AX17_004013 [Amanita inopinata Kibby_2008]|nr:hypothetical protein AX17_004013 [Amanita inopinata Kibby_2008]